jgi:hypothetical protein
MQRRTRLIASAVAAATAALSLLPSAATAAPKPASLVTFGPAGQTSVSESFTPPGATPILGEFDGTNGEDIIWYTPGAGGDALWAGNGEGTWTAKPLSISGTYTPYVGNFGNEDKGDDILWYSTTGASQLWNYHDGAVTKTSLPTVTGSGTILVGDFTTDGVQDIVRYRPGAQAEVWWDFEDPDAAAFAITTRSFSVNGTYTPLVGSFSKNPIAGDYGDDILWYAPGAAADTLWDFEPHGTYDSYPISINGTFTPLVGRFMDSPHDQILWYAPGAAADSLWSFTEAHTITKKALTINGTYTPYTCECVKSGAGDRDDILWHGVGNAPDAVWSNKGIAFNPTSYSYSGTTIRGSKLALPYAIDFQQSALAYG